MMKFQKSLTNKELIRGFILSTAVTYSGDDSPCKEEGAAEVPHAALIGGVTRGIDPGPDSRHHLLRMREQVSGIISKNAMNHFKLKPKMTQTLDKKNFNQSHHLLPSHVIPTLCFLSL